MKEFKIEGNLHIEDDLSHQEFISKFHVLLKAYGIHFSGYTKEVKEEIHNK